MSKHTPGPCGGFGPTYCHTWIDKVTGEETILLCRLHVVAPGLYEALKKLVAATEACYGDPDEGWSHDPKCETCREMEKARAVLAKAEGND